MAATTERGVPLSTLCPRFLHTNSTSHTWPFSAIAELIDNAYDPDVRAKQLWIDKTMIKEEECLSFMDNGNGLDYETMHKMLSFGYSDKTAVNGIQPIGTYGNGFKSGSMRLGRDAIVFSKSKSATCVGMLSQTYLEKIHAQQIIVPMVSFEQITPNQFSAKDKHKTSLQDILRYSPFTSQEELITELNLISHPFCTENTGTRIIIWNLRRTTDGKSEFDFEKDRYDIRIPDDIYEAMNNHNPDRATSYIPESVCSLRAYCSILYLKPRMQVVIRGQKVKTQLISKSLANIRKDYYKPTFLPKRMTITFGYNTKSKDQYGIMMYHKNRLIKAYERIGCQLKANNQGVGVIGIIECNFLDPTHNKQSFIESDKYRKTMSSVGIKLEDYCKETRYRWNVAHPNSTTAVEDAMKRPDQNWVQCDDCLQWRKLPDGIDCDKLPDKWFCHMNPDPQFRNCSVLQELEDSDDEQHTYRKTYKLKEKENKKQEIERKREEEERKRQDQQHLAILTKQTENIKRRSQSLARQLQTTLNPSTSQSPRFRTDSVQGGAARAESTPLSSSTISQAAYSPSSYSGLPIITSVCSLSPGPQRGKRAEPFIPQTTPKRPRVNIPQTCTLSTGSSWNVSPLASPSVPADDNCADDDIVILETLSTAKPNKPNFDMGKVKTENQESNADVNMLMECSDDAAVDVKLESDVLGISSTGAPAVATSPSPACPPGQASTSTQTGMLKVKKEEMCQDQTEERAGQSTSNEDAVCATQEKSTQQNVVTAVPACDAELWKLAATVRYSPPHHVSINEVQEQQNHLLQLMQETAEERDSLKEQVSNLTCQLKDMERKLQELPNQISVKKDSSHQATQTEETVERESGEHYKILFEKAKKKIDELIEQKKALPAATGSMSSTDNGEDTDEISLQVDRLLRELDQTKKEKDKLLAQLDNLENERANLASQCEELRLSHQQLMENVQDVNKTPERATDPSIQSELEEAGGTGSDSSDTLGRFIELRQSIGRLLISYVPDLERNYDSNIIDEFLEQIVLRQSASESPGMQRD